MENNQDGATSKKNNMEQHKMTKTKLKSTEYLPIKKWVFQSMFANLPIKFRNRQCSLTWTEVYELLHKKE